MLYINPEMYIARNYLIKLWPTASTLASYIQRARPDLDPNRLVQPAVQFQQSAFQYQPYAQAYANQYSEAEMYWPTNYSFLSELSESSNEAGSSLSSLYDYMTDYSPLE